jgi:hypothetical protein
VDCAEQYCGFVWGASTHTLGRLCGMCRAKQILQLHTSPYHFSRPPPYCATCPNQRDCRTLQFSGSPRYTQHHCYVTQTTKLVMMSNSIDLSCCQKGQASSIVSKTCLKFSSFSFSFSFSSSSRFVSHSMFTSVCATPLPASTRVHRLSSARVLYVNVS